MIQLFFAAFLLTGRFLFCQSQKDIVNGNLIQFNSNGAWCWYQDERAVIDVSQNKIIIGSNRTSNGHDYVDLFDLSTRTVQNNDLGYIGSDDHDAPGILIRPDGKYLVMFSKHNSDKITHYKIFSSGYWSVDQTFDWNTQPGGDDFYTTYSNVYYLSDEDRTYDFSRGNGHGGQNFIVSSNQGDRWTYGGFLTTNANIGYVNGYFKYCSNGLDRIDFVCTEYHPRDFNTSIYHGYIKNGETFNSNGIVIDTNIFDKIPTRPQDYTPVITADTIINNFVMSHCWNTDVQRYPDGTIAAIVTARTNSDPDNPTHAFIYCRYDGIKWASTYLCNAGLKLYSSEQDYTGLAALCPDDPNTIYISTPIDPRDDTTILGVHEIFEGVTNDHGTTWNWSPVTQNSTSDNLRPIIPQWDGNHKALLWFRGKYYSAQNINAAIVGIINSPFEKRGKMKYIDASSSNTSFAGGSALITTGPDGNQGPADNKWHIRTGFGNGGSVLTSGEIDVEDAPELKTKIIIAAAGTYDIWINFWANPDEDWRIKAGLNVNTIQVFRQTVCKEVQPGDHDPSIVLTGAGSTFLYQAYIGRVKALSNDSIYIYIDDYAVQSGGSTRTWYDGVSYAEIGNSVVPVELTSFTARLNGTKVELNWETKTESNNQGFEIEKNSLVSPFIETEGGWKVIGFVKGKGTTAETSKYSFFDKNINQNLMRYRIKQIDYNGSYSYSKVIEVKCSINNNYTLYQNFPNPFNPVTTISFTLPAQGFVQLKIYNSLGQEISNLVDKQMNSGSYRINWNAQNFPSGIYFYKISIDNFSKIHKMILLK
jgi:hypothetical protein